MIAQLITFHPALFSIKLILKLHIETETDRQTDRQTDRDLTSELHGCSSFENSFRGSSISPDEKDNNSN